MIWFTADTHFGHANIIKHCERPFADVHEMNKVLTTRWNQVVRSTDEVWHLGDFAFRSDPAAYLSRLNGHVHLVLGNHDKEMQCRRAGFASVQQVCCLRDHGERFWLSHYAHRTWYGSHHGVYHLYGHVHGRFDATPTSLDVGVDAWGFRPVPMSTVLGRFSELRAETSRDERRHP